MLTTSVYFGKLYSGQASPLFIFAARGGKFFQTKGGFSGVGGG
jgi:hypothetical protein